MSSNTEQRCISDWKKFPEYFKNYNNIIVKQPDNCSTLFADDIVCIVIAILKKSKEEDLFFQLKKSKNSIYLRARDELSGCIYFYSDKNNGVIVFQRRFGCSVQFSNFYDEIKSIMINDYPDIFKTKFKSIPSVQNSYFEFISPSNKTLVCCNPCIITMPSSTPIKNT